MIHKIKLYELRRAIRNIIIEADEEEDRRGPVAKMKGWQPPQNMVSGTDTTDWTTWDRDDVLSSQSILHFINRSTADFVFDISNYYLSNCASHFLSFSVAYHVS